VMNWIRRSIVLDAAAFAGVVGGDLTTASLEASGVGCTRLAIHAVPPTATELDTGLACAEATDRGPPPPTGALAAGRLEGTAQSEMTGRTVL